jgi:hypothetical protein
MHNAAPGWHPAHILSGSAPTRAVFATSAPVLSPDFDLASAPRGADLVAWSGGLGDNLFEPDPRTWLPGGWERLRARLDHALPTLLGRGQRLFLRTHARHVISDGPSSARLATWAGESGFATAFFPLLDAGAILTTPMRPTAEDHLDRTGDWVNRLASPLGCVLSDWSSDGDDPDRPAAPLPCADWSLPRTPLAHLAQRTISAGLPLGLDADPGTAPSALDALWSLPPQPAPGRG